MPDPFNAAFRSVSVPQGTFLRQKLLYEYTTADNIYDVELFVNQDDTYYAIAVPRESERLVVYGSRVLPSAEEALQELIHKIPIPESPPKPNV
ncbi:MAG: hypothetical protein K6T63_03020 [Alicyclobacillus herbarius]|uniref:hypothetical protein n=1 Tax=Alicyclobacillus herbarius TaxID=122960 RepID=UPI00040F996E|nr:hypothetical protein [Alicyclobacillus herbarius]MCL6631578.1 hypothetical protein [Alicyclobacillus herbarius]